MDNTQGAIDGLVQSGVNHEQAVGFVTELVQGHAIMFSINEVFLDYAILFLTAVVTIWLAPKPAPITGPSLGH